MSVTFKKIPTSLRKPGCYIEFNIDQASAGLPSGVNKCLLLGQKTSAGTATVNVPYEIYTESDAITYFGAGSILHQMVRAALKANGYVVLYAVAVTDAAESVAAAGTITFTGPATAAGLLNINIGNITLQKSVAVDETAAEIAADVAELVNDKVLLPVTATVAEGVVTLTAKNKGTLGNAIVISYTNTASGITVTVTAMTGGLVDPDLEAVLTAIKATRWHLIASPYFDTTSLGDLKTHIEAVSDPVEQKGGVVIFPYVGTLANAETLTANYSSSGRMVCIYLRGTASLPWELSAAAASRISGEEDPALPLDGVVLENIAAPAIADRLLRTEQETCLHNGITPCEVNSKTEVELVRVITTFTQTDSGVASAALLDISKIRCLDYTREAVRDMIKTKYSQAKLDEDGKTIGAIKTDIYNVLLKEKDAQILTNVVANKDMIIVEESTNVDGRVNARIPAAVIDGMHIFAGEMLLL